MSEIFSIQSSIKSYEVKIARGEAVDLLLSYPDLVVIDEKVKKLWSSLPFQQTIEVEAIEENKTMQKSSEIIESLRVLGATRKDTMLAIGGGIIQDVATLSASLYMRGINWVYMPTTLLGMVDSCIGGKSSINVGKYKNIAGNFYPPSRIVVDTDFCSTLEEQQLVEGLFEAVKICYAHSEEKLDQYLSLVDANSNLHNLPFDEIVQLSLLTKKEFIEEDEFDEGVRLLLNFGHTFGHALEGASQFAIRHGVAVGLGILCAYNLSLSLTKLNANNHKAIKLISHIKSMLSKVPNLKETIDQLNMITAFDRFKSDKKHTKDNYVMILFDGHGALFRLAVAKSSINEQLILEKFEGLKNEI
jgi:3-dehydroquinate synthase